MRRTARAARRVLSCLPACAAGVCLAADAPHDTAMVRDLAYGEVLFHFYQEDYFTALTRLLAAEARAEIPTHRLEAELLLGGLYLSYGQHRLAGEIFDRVLTQSLHRHVSPDAHDRAWFFLAKIWYQRGYIEEADAALGRIAGSLPRALEAERRMLQAQVAMERGRYEEALARLQAWHRPDDEWVGYARYNIGVALVRLGRVEEGARVLSDVGRLPGDDPARAALRDKANVALGYAWLQAGRAAEAKLPLQRVRLDGPYSNQALLAVGWADAELGDYARALAPWIELRGRATADPAVQEALLAAPYAFAQLQAERQAVDFYVDAIEAFNEEIARLGRAIEAVRSGELVAVLLEQREPGPGGWYRSLESAPRAAQGQYLHELMASHAFQEAVKNYGDLVDLRANLADWAESLTVFDDILDARQHAYDERTPVVEDVLRRVDLERTESRRLAAEARLAAIEGAEDVTALGTPSQQALMRELTALAPDVARVGALPEGEELMHKHRVLQGLLLWDLQRDYPARLWHQQSTLREVDQALAEARRRRDEVETLRAQWPQRYEELRAHIAVLSPRLDTLLASLDTSLVRQARFIDQLAVGELQARQARLDGYRVEARFALATLYDRGAASAAVAAPSTSSEPRP